MDVVVGGHGGVADVDVDRMDHELLEIQNNLTIHITIVLTSLGALVRIRSVATPPAVMTVVATEHVSFSPEDGGAGCNRGL